MTDRETNICSELFSNDSKACEARDAAEFAAAVTSTTSNAPSDNSCFDSERLEFSTPTPDVDHDLIEIRDTIKSDNEISSSKLINFAVDTERLGSSSIVPAKKVRFKRLLSSFPAEEDQFIGGHDEDDNGESEIFNVNQNRSSDKTSLNTDSRIVCDSVITSGANDEISLNYIVSATKTSNLGNDSHSEEEEEEGTTTKRHLKGILRYRDQYNRLRSHPSPTSFGGRLLEKIKSFGYTSSSHDNIDGQYVAYEDKDLLTGASKYQIHSRRKLTSGRTFRGSYRYSRAESSMFILQRMLALIFQKSTAALLGAFLIHVTLGTIYTLSNINSYLTSYMRKHGSPDATYGGSMWISSSYAIGQGFSMVLGGYLEKRFSAQLSCAIGCALHSLSIISTSRTIDHGYLAVLMSYGFIPGFGCGLAYMTPMSNGFGWFPKRKGLVAGVILAGFGIGTFVFNMVQTAFVNPNNMSPTKDGGADGYFTQDDILNRVPHLFVFVGTIYAAMQFVGCCLLFKPPKSAYHSGKSQSIQEDNVELIENEMSFHKAVRSREFLVLFTVYGITTQGILFVNSMLKEYGQMFIGNDMYLAWTGSMASIANSLGRLTWGLAIDTFSFTQCFTCITIIFGSLLFIMPFEAVLSSKLLYLLCTLGIFGTFSGWMSTYPVHVSRVFGRSNSGMIYGLIFVSQSLGSLFTAVGVQYLIDHYSRFVPFFCVVALEATGLLIYHMFYPK